MKINEIYEIENQENSIAVVKAVTEDHIDIVVYFLRDGVLQHNWTAINTKKGKKKSSLTKLILSDKKVKSLSSWLKLKGL